MLGKDVKVCKIGNGCLVRYDPSKTNLLPLVENAKTK